MLCGPTPHRPAARPECRKACRHSIDHGRATPWQCVFHSPLQPGTHNGSNAPCSAWSRPFAWPCRPRRPLTAPTPRLRKAPSAKRADSGSVFQPSAAARRNRPSNATSGCTANARAGTTPGHAPDIPGSRPAGIGAERSPSKNSPTPQSDSGKAGNALSPLDFSDASSCWMTVHQRYDS